MIEHRQSPENAEETRRAHRQLLIKGLIAGVAVVVLVVALVMLEGTHESEPTPTAHTVTPTGGTPPSEEQSTSLAEANTQALRNSSEAAELQSVVMAEQSAAASAASAPVVPEESVEPLAAPVPTQASAPRAAHHRETSGRLVLEQSPPKAGHSSAPGSSPAAPVKPAAPVVSAASAASSVVAPAGFFVQVGVFTNPGNAEELSAKLKAAGIPTQVETRVQVGPFKSRQEAIAAQARLKSLGMDAGMVVPAKH
ncbi:MAG: sporulation related domain protein [Rhodocyclales bacterium]|nr:sporulation related domain protein [Rhodocyclales bacterium]